MRTKENMKRMVTPVGIAYWPYIGVQVEKYQGKESRVFYPIKALRHRYREAKERHFESS